MHLRHFMFLVETCLKNDDTATLVEACPPNYKFVQTVKQDKRGSGIAAIFSNQFRCTETDLGEYSSFEYLAIVLKTESRRGYFNTTDHLSNLQGSFMNSLILCPVFSLGGTKSFSSEI